MQQLGEKIGITELKQPTQEELKVEETQEEISDIEVVVDNKTSFEKRADERKKQEEIDNNRWEAKKQRLKQEEILKKEARQKALLQPNIKNNMIIWLDINKNGSVYEGRFKDKKMFEIRRGTITFSLKIANDKIQSAKKNFSSTELIKLQITANKILKENINLF